MSSPCYLDNPRNSFIFITYDAKIVGMFTPLDLLGFKYSQENSG
jgi:hypothetical protein